MTIFRVSEKARNPIATNVGVLNFLQYKTVKMVMIFPTKPSNAIIKFNTVIDFSNPSDVNSNSSESNRWNDIL